MNHADRARTTLEALLKEAEPLVGEVKRGHFSQWGDEDSARKRRSDSGLGHIAEAVRIARRALASGDADEMIIAANYCPQFMRDGVKRAANHAAAVTRRAGGAARGQTQHDDAATRMKPYVEKYHSLLAQNVPHLKARKRVLGQMVKDGLDGGLSVRTQNKWFPKPAK